MRYRHTFLIEHREGNEFGHFYNEQPDPSTEWIQGKEQYLFDQYPDAIAIYLYGTRRIGRLTSCRT